MICTFCGEEISIAGKVSRSDTCPHCGGDLRCCKQCNFYKPRAYNECMEVQAERIVDKDRTNFCDYFVAKGPAKKKMNRTQNAREALEALFKKQD